MPNDELPVLPRDQVQSIQRALEQIARHVRDNGAAPGADRLNAIVRTCSVQEEWVRRELGYWGDLLARIPRLGGDAGTRAVVREALMDRGVTEATAILAVVIAAEYEPEEAPHTVVEEAKRQQSELPRTDLGGLRVSSATVGLGIIPPGERRSAVVEVMGGGGRVRSMSPRVTVEPNRIGSSGGSLEVSVQGSTHRFVLISPVVIEPSDGRPPVGFDVVAYSPGKPKPRESEAPSPSARHATPQPAPPRPEQPVPAPPVSETERSSRKKRTYWDGKA